MTEPASDDDLKLYEEMVDQEINWTHYTHIEALITRIRQDAETIKRMDEALANSVEGWANVIEMNLIPERHKLTASILRDEASAARKEQP